ncbi:polyisoprenoid-binding protein YceI [Nakamurella sp. UYEF19]|uniref:YceI family protein n=1 Tax=Nakamurella sp. UYEF19 TaxID=1756392 RepID=UPI003399E32C
MADTSLAAYVGTWTLDAAATSIEFRTKAMWLLPVKGTFKAVSGTGVATDDGTVTGTLVIDPASVGTGMAKRDAHLATDDFFDVAKYPTFTYTLTGVKPATDGKLTLLGTFTAHGQTHPLELVGTINSAAPGAVTVTAEGDLDRTEWSLNWTKMGAGVHNHLIVKAVFKRA